MLALSLLAGILWMSPAETTQPVRAAVRDVLLPGQMFIASSQDRMQHWTAPWHNKTQSTSPEHDKELAALKQQIQMLELRQRQWVVRNLQLQQQLQQYQISSSAPPLANDTPSLLVPDLVEARLLGQETGPLWRSKRLLSIGQSHGATESALVLEGTKPLLDLGQDHGLASEQPIYAGRVVVGRIAQAGRWSSTLRLVTDLGYSGLARLVRVSPEGLVSGPRANLQGDGTPTCLLKWVKSHEAVAVGDLVFTGETDGILPSPMYYGKVISCDLPEGATEWSIRVEPACLQLELQSVQVLRTRLNAARMAAN